MKCYLVLLVLGLLGCVTTGGGTYTVEGKILDDGGSVYDNVEIQLRRPDGTEVQTTLSGGGGFFAFPDVPAGSYLIVLDTENQMDGPLPVQPIQPIPIQVKPGSAEGFLTIRLTSNLNSAQRLRVKYAADFSRWESENASPANAGAVVFTGSSSIRLWSTLAQDFPDYKVLNRGFGGSTAAELRQVLDLVLASRPTAVVIYEGDNDLAAEGSEVSSFLEHMEAIGKAIEQTVPRERIILLSIKPSRTRAARWPVYRVANEGLRELARTRGYTFADVSTPMLNGDRVNDLYMGNDGLHMSAEGYKLWRDVLTPILRRVIPRRGT